MRSAAALLSLAAAGTVYGHANMGHLLDDLQNRDTGAPGGSTAMLGDLIDHSPSSVAGGHIKAMLEGSHSAMGSDGHSGYTAPGPKGSDACKKDTCCIWSYLVAEMVAAFEEGGQCGPLARQAIRLGFHDAGAWNVSLSYGGADGSILLTDEISRHDNLGMQDIAAKERAWYDEYKQYGVGMADLIQMGTLVATVVCPGGPRIRAFVGRADDAREPPEGLLPGGFDQAEHLIELFAAKTLDIHDLISLLGAHSTSQQFFTDPSRAGAPQDTTDGIWDTLYYDQTASPSPPPEIYRFPADVSLANDPSCRPTWQMFQGPKGQMPWAMAYSQAYFRVSLLGVKNLNALTECTKVLPMPRARPGQKH